MQDHTKSSDEELVGLAKKDSDVFEILVARYWDKLFFFVKRISGFTNEDIEDSLQEVFIKVYKYLNDFDSSYKFSTWIYQIARNTAIDESRRKKSRPRGIDLEEDELLKIFKSSVDVSKEIDDKNQLEKIKSIIHDLPLRYREIMILRFLEEKTYDEIIDIVRKPKGTVASLVSRGRKIILKEMKKKKIVLN
ncbi:RNA polymerase sigma factor [Patescibacteria group bacterium]